MSLSNKQLKTLERIKGRNGISIDASKLLRLFKAAGAVEAEYTAPQAVKLKFRGASCFIKKPEKAKGRTKSFHHLTWQSDIVHMARILHSANSETEPTGTDQLN